MYMSNLKRRVADIFNNLEENIELTYDNNNISELQQAITKIDNIQKNITEAWMDMEYCGQNAQYYDNFASKYGETQYLKESDYITFDLDGYTVKTISGESKRTWIYEHELSLIKDKLCEKKKYN